MEQPKQFMIGNTKVRISTDFCRDKTTAEVEKILDNIVRHAKAAGVGIEERKCIST